MKIMGRNGNDSSLSDGNNVKIAYLTEGVEG